METTAPLSIKECFRFGWTTFKSRPWLFVWAFVTILVANVIINATTNGIEQVADTSDGVVLVLLYLFSIILSTVITTFIGMGTTNFILRAHDNTGEAKMRDLTKFHPFISYLATELLTGLAVLIGFVLLIVPGIILAIAFSFAPYLVIDKNRSAIAAMKESFALTRGHRWKLFLLMLAILGANILGFIALFVGLFVSVPVSMLALAHAYRTLSAEQPAVAAAA